MQYRNQLPSLQEKNDQNFTISLTWISSSINVVKSNTFSTVKNSSVHFLGKKKETPKRPSKTIDLNCSTNQSS